MNVTRMRGWMKKYGSLAVPVVAGCLAANYLWKRKTLSLTALVALGGLAYGIQNRSVVTETCMCGGETFGPKAEVGPQQTYAIIEIGSLGGEFTLPLHTNNNGQVIGMALNSDNKVRPFLWQSGKMTDLGTLAGSQAAAYGLNDVGKVVGLSEADANGKKFGGFLWQSGKMAAVGTLGGDFSGANAINRNGDIVGGSVTGKQEFHAFVSRGGKLEDIGANSGTDMNTATAVNNRGVVVGVGVKAREDKLFGLIWNGGKAKILRGLNGQEAVAQSVNDDGVVLGTSLGEGGCDAPVRAVLWQGDRPKDLGLLSGYSDAVGLSINNRGQAVGVLIPAQNRQMPSAAMLHLFASSASDAYNDMVKERDYLFRMQAAGEMPHPFLWENGKMTDLNKMLPSDSGWELLTAYSIDDGGSIVGLGLKGNEIKPFKMFQIRD